MGAGGGAKTFFDVDPTPTVTVIGDRLLELPGPVSDRVGTGGWSEARPEALVEEAVVDAYAEHEQTSAFQMMIEERLVLLPIPPPAGPKGIAAYRHGSS